MPLPDAPAIDPAQAATADATTSPAVQVRGLVKRYDGRAVVDGLDLVARPGAVTAVLGPNGAGKTTTIECCEGLRSPDAGTVRVLGLDPVADARALRPRVGVMLQDGGLPTGVRALELLRHVSAMYAAPRAVGELADRLGLHAFARTTVRRLSGGQRQRVALAAAVIGRPEVVFLDEPSAGMDPQSRRAVWDLVRELRADGVAIVLTTHLMDEAADLADHVHVVDHGRVIASGTVRELTDGGAGPASIRVEATPGLDLAPLRTTLRPGEWVVGEGEPGVYTVTGPVDPAALAAVTGWLAGQGVLARSVTTGSRTLEDVFLDLTGRNLR
ncbi:ABC transporter ATP-binding protein [Promicromonospora sp. NPDC052451]|uniref:ABC transporter ATP-binding protein n=1 Tax=Promicromonospora sp. NPDC052451 TaxID=3364407 RepID=UPI0037C615E6